MLRPNCVQQSFLCDIFYIVSLLLSYIRTLVCYVSLSISLSLSLSVYRTDDVSDQPHKSMEEVSVNLKAGDILLSAGIGVGGAIIRVADGSPFSHVSVVVNDPYIDEPCIWESFGNSAGLCLVYIYAFAVHLIRLYSQPV